MRQRRENNWSFLDSIATDHIEIDYDTDGDGPDKVRKVKIRRAHRASAIRLCNGAYENINAEVVNVVKLRQQWQSIMEKVQTLAKLDDEMLDLVEEEALETEIEEADIVREWLALCIIDIDEAIGLAETLLLPQSHP